MSKTIISPDEVLNTLLARSPRSNKATTLKALHEICLSHYKTHNESLRDFSLAAIGRICESRGLFKARILYNAASQDYVALIKAWEAFSGPSRIRAPKESKERHNYQYLMQIEDPALRSLIQSAIAERDDLRAKVNLLKSQMHITIDQRPLGINISKGSTLITIQDIACSLTDSERSALKKAISKEFLDQEEWTEGAFGEIKNQSGRTVYDVGYVTAITKILG